MITANILQVIPPMNQVTVSERTLLPSPFQLIGQGVTVGSLGSGICVLVHAICVPNPYNFLLVPVLPAMLVLGAVYGLACGLAIWVATRLVALD